MQARTAWLALAALTVLGASAAQLDPQGVEKKKYVAFGMVHDDYRDYLVDLGENSSEITLNEDGTGSMTLSTEKNEGKIEKWKVEGGLIDVTISNRTLFGPVKDGNVLQLYFEKETLTIYYAKEGTDTSSYNVLTQEAFKEAIAKK